MKRRGGWLVALASVPVLMLAGCVSPAAPAAAGAGGFADAPPDPALPGGFDVVRAEYDLGLVLVDDPMFPTPEGPHVPYTYPVQLTGNVHYPATGDGPFPVLAFMHGRHGTCAVAGIEGSFTHVCPTAPPIVEPVRSYAGYDYLGANLASHGYVVFSINANQVNDRDLAGDRGAQARAQTIVGTLDAVAALNRAPGPEPIGDDLVGRLDLSRIGLMGHSRGGEGVARAVLHNADRTDGEPHAIRAVLGLAPTNYNRQVVPNVAYATILPYCDGDVFDFMGAQTFDDSRYLAEADPMPKMTVLAMGANHNYYNTYWTGDDAGAEGGGRNDPYCAAAGQPNHATSGRLGPDDQRRHGLVLMAAFLRAYAGGEDAFARLFTGAADLPDSACPATEIPCPGRFHVSYHAPATDRLVIDDFADADSDTANDAGGANRYDGFAARGVCAPAACPSQPNFHHAHQLTLAWDGEATFTAALAGTKGIDLTGFDVVSFRVGINFEDGRNERNVSQDFEVILSDARGKSAHVRVSDWSAAAFYPPGDGARRVVLNMVDVPLAAFAGVKLDRVTAVGLHFAPGTTGSVQLADLMFQRPG